MASKLEKIFETSPAWFKDLMATIEGTRLYYMRRAGVYKEKRELYQQLRTRSYQELLAYQKEKFSEIFYDAKEKSPYYARKYKNINEPDISKIPILEKEELRANIDQFVIGDRKELLEFYTGGTTGKGIKLFLRRSSLQDRISMLDLFWKMHGYEFRDRCAWFSGRNLVHEDDARKNIFWRTNWYLNIRYYSTFHLSQDNLAYYVDNINRYKPVFFSGFPSAVYELAQYMSIKRIKPEFQLKGIFTTSETLYPTYRETIESLFNCKVRDQYSSTEGSPWIIECPHGRRHYDPASGIMEVVDESGNPAEEGEILATSFTMREVPIIRYRIGDYVKMSGQIGCSCGWDTPIVDKIEGRKMDYIEIPGRGKIWCSQIGDCVKGVNSVISFQVELLDNNRVKIYIIANRDDFEKKDKEKFLKNFRERAGDVPIEIVYVNRLEKSKSGKHSVIKQ